MLSIKDADFSWAKNAVEPTLENINLSVKKGELAGILGRVGAGKVLFSIPVLVQLLNDSIDKLTFCHHR